MIEHLLICILSILSSHGGYHHDIPACTFRCSSPASIYRLRAGSNDKYEGVYYRVKRIVRHPAYNFLTIDYDIALLEVYNIELCLFLLLSFYLAPISLFLLVNDLRQLTITTSVALARSGNFISDRRRNRI